MKHIEKKKKKKEKRIGNGIVGVACILQVDDMGCLERFMLGHTTNRIRKRERTSSSFLNLRAFHFHGDHDLN